MSTLVNTTSLSLPFKGKLAPYQNALVYVWACSISGLGSCFIFTIKFIFLYQI